MHARLLFLLVMAVGALCAPAHATTITYFTSSLAQTLTGNGTGTPVRVASNAGSATGANVSAAGNFNDANARRAASASASLSSATLEAASSVDQVTSTDPALTLYSSGQAYIGDSFTHGSTSSGGKSPFVWTASSTATFSFAIDGSSAFSGGASDLDTTFVYLDIFKAGTLGQHLMAIGANPQIYTFAPQSPNFGSDLLYDVAFGLTPTSTSYTKLLGGSSPVTQLVDLSHGAANVSFAFQPDADFDWVVVLATNTTLHGGEPTAFATADFADTVGVSYTPPSGAVVRSASGEFPGAPAAIPEPDLPALLGIGAVLMIGRKRMRGARAAASAHLGVNAET